MSENYEISVVTPFHNVEMKYFDGAIKSMLEQTIGFEKIQWIIVLHNCEPKYLPMLKERLGGHPNVVLTELNNAACTPSSPRNHGVKLATAPYIGYLDGDDSYKPNCLAECVRNAKETGSQIVCFRRDYELENESLVPLNEIVLWNQLKSRIVIEHGNWDMPRMFSGIWAFVTSKVFEREFLTSRHIEFDEEIPYCEDGMYSLCALAQAKRICYLPQLIGYHYYINGGSLVQNRSKSSKTLVDYARGMAKIVRQAYDFGVDINEFAQVLLEHQSNFMLHSDVTPEDREEIKRLLAPIIYKTVPVAPSKTVTAEWSAYAFNLCREVILGDGGYAANKCLMELRSGLLTLHRILSANQNADYGQEYQFHTLQTIAAFQFHVPLTRLASYQKLIDLQVKIGERGILTSERISGYIRGEDGGLVPYTDAHIRPFVLATAAILRGHHSIWVAQCELSGRTLNDRTRVHSLGSVIVKNYFFDCIYAGGMRPASFSTPDGAFFSAEADENDYGGILHHALLDREPDQIVAVNAAKVMRMFELVETDRADVLARLRGADPERADEVAVALADFDAGRERNLARRLWPKLGRVVACGTGRYARDRERVRRYTGDITWNNGVVFMPEMVLGHAEADDTDRYIFDGTGCFCEFFQNDSDEISKPKLIVDLEEGHTYNVIVTNDSGLYRVVTDVEIRVVGRKDDDIIVEFLQ